MDSSVGKIKFRPNGRYCLKLAFQKICQLWKLEKINKTFPERDLKLALKTLKIRTCKCIQVNYSHIVYSNKECQTNQKLHVQYFGIHYILQITWHSYNKISVLW